MNNDEMLKLILSKIESLEAGQNSMRSEMNDMRSEMSDMRSEMKDMNRRLDTLEEGQKAIRRDVARVDRKLDRLSADIGDTLVYVTENVDTEINQLREAK